MAVDLKGKKIITMKIYGIIMTAIVVTLCTVFIYIGVQSNCVAISLAVCVILIGAVKRITTKM